MSQLPTHISSLRIQRGQAMIEYAILLLLLVMIFVGGAEIGSTALASYKNTDAAKSAISEYAEINQRRLNSLNAISQYANKLHSICPFMYYKYEDTDTDAIKEIFFQCSTSSTLPSGYTQIPTNYIDFIIDNVQFSTTTSVFNEVSFEDYQLAIVRNTETIANYTSALDEIDELDENGDGEILLDEIYQAEQSIKDSTTISATDETLQLIYIELLKLRHLPLLTDDDEDGVDDFKITEAMLNVGNHNPASFSEPNCPSNNGMPADQYIFRKFNDNAGNTRYYDNYDPTNQLAIYLFSPLPINTTNCTGSGVVSDLINGLEVASSGIRSDTSENALTDFLTGFVPGLPKLNQAMYGMYERVCVNAANEYISCNDFANVSRTLLKPPGKICFPDGVANADNCPSNPPDNITGFYRWGKSNEASKNNKGKVEESSYQFNTENEIADASGISGFRPTFQLDCAFQPNVVNDQLDNCNNINPSKVRVHTRYRKVFEGFLTFGLLELGTTANNELGFFYNPNNVATSNHVNSVAGSEVGPLGANQRPTVKYFRDFRGCYEVDVETNQVSACN